MWAFAIATVLLRTVMVCRLLGGLARGSLLTRASVLFACEHAGRFRGGLLGLLWSGSCVEVVLGYCIGLAGRFASCACVTTNTNQSSNTERHESHIYPRT